MKLTSKAVLFAPLSLLMFSACHTTVLKTEPKGGTLRHDAVVYIENDGRCAKGEIVKVTGGNDSLQVPRKYECVARSN